MVLYREEFTDVNMSYRDYENWRNETLIATEERHELLDEVKALEDAEQVLRDTIAIQKDLVRIQAGIISKRDTKIADLRAELELERSRYTLGGVPPGYRPWGNVKLPPPPSAESGRFDGS